MKKKRPVETARQAARPVVASQRASSAPSRRGLTSVDGGAATVLVVRAQPGAKRAGFGGFWNDMPKIAVCAPPEDGRANAELVLELAELLGVRASAVELVAGATARVKRFRIACAPAAVEARLRELDERKPRRS